MSNRFTVHPLLHRPGQAMIARDGEHLITVPDVAAANLLADLLAKAAHVADVAADRIGGGDEDVGKIAMSDALARALAHERPPAAAMIGALSQRILSLAPEAGLRVGITIAPANAAIGARA